MFVSSMITIALYPLFFSYVSCASYFIQSSTFKFRQFCLLGYIYKNKMQSFTQYDLNVFELFFTSAFYLLVRFIFYDHLSMRQADTTSLSKS